MIRFFPKHVAYTVQLLGKYSEFIASKDSSGIAVIPIILERIEGFETKRN